MAYSAISPNPDRSDLRSVARLAVLRAANMMNCRSRFTGNAEPSLDEVMDDPVIRVLMAKDGVGEDCLRGLIDQVRNRLL